tara:strand:+ start:126 stop:416 length:291 start_codon:yes stop_codon:yes gene_type:complete
MKKEEEQSSNEPKDPIEEGNISASNTNDKRLIDDFDSEYSKWVDNSGNEVKEVFGFNENAELVNSRAAMFGFIMLILTELVFKGEAATKSIFGIGL